MAIAPVNGLSQSLPQASEIGSATRSQDAKGTSANFQQLITDGVGSVNQKLNDASQMSKEFLTQGKHDLHEVMIALDQADLSFRYMVQIRNKVLDAYNDVMRMQV